MSKNKYDVVVIGAGSAGLTAARTAAKFGVKVALFEKHRIGGDCLYTGCVPSKSLISAARKITNAKNLTEFGVVTKVKMNYPAIRKKVEDSIRYIKEHEDSRTLLENDGITVIEKKVTFKDSNTLQDTGGTEYKFRKAIIASGSSPNEIKIKGLKKEHVLNSDSVWELEHLPKDLVIVGGGPIGLELGQAFSMLGSNVTIIERGKKLLTRLDDHIGEAVLVGLKKSGVKVLFDSKIISVKDETTLKLTVKTGEKSETYIASKVLMAVGRTPNTNGLGIENISVELKERGGIEVDEKLRTATKNIYAAGDVIGGPLFTHWAGEQAATALTHALFGVRRKVAWDALPWALFTTPEVAHVGANENELLSKNSKYTKEILPYSDIDKAIAEHTSGSITVLLDKKRKILGATIIGNNASELIGYYAYIMATDEKIDKLAEPIQAYPTYAMAIRKHASDITFRAFTDTLVPKILLKLRGY